MKKFLSDTIVLIVSIALLILPAVSYRYPFLFPDSGTYLSSGHLGYVPVDRPIIYGLFVKLVSFSWSVWMVIICQSILWNYIIYLLVKFTIGVKKYNGLVHLLLAIFLAVFTGFSYYCSLVLADIFSSIAVLSLFFLLTLNKKQKTHLILISILFVFSIITHLSHIPLVLSILIVVTAYYFIKGKNDLRQKSKRLFSALGLMLFSLFLISLVNYSYGVGFKISRTNNIILATRFIESGLANKYLKKNCGKEGFDPDYKDLCNYVDKFDQWPAAGFYLYDFENSPIYNGTCIDIDWTECWVQKNKEYGNLIEDILSDGELRGEFVNLVLTGTLKQLVTFEQSSLSAQDFGSIIDQFYPSDSNEFKYSLQSRTALLFDQANYLELRVLILSLLILLFFIVKKWRVISEKEKLLIVIVIFSLLNNAMITSTLSNVIARYQGRLIFLIPLVVFCLFVKYMINNYKLVNRKNEDEICQD